MYIVQGIIETCHLLGHGEEWDIVAGKQLWKKLALNISIQTFTASFQIQLQHCAKCRVTFRLVMPPKSYTLHLILVLCNTPYNTSLSYPIISLSKPVTSLFQIHFIIIITLHFLSNTNNIQTQIISLYFLCSVTE